MLPYISFDLICPWEGTCCLYSINWQWTIWFHLWLSRIARVKAVCTLYISVHYRQWTYRQNSRIDRRGQHLERRRTTNCGWIRLPWLRLPKTTQTNRSLQEIPAFRCCQMCCCVLFETGLSWQRWFIKFVNIDRHQIGKRCISLRSRINSGSWTLSKPSGSWPRKMQGIQLRKCGKLRSRSRSWRRKPRPCWALTQARHPQRCRTMWHWVGRTEAEGHQLIWLSAIFMAPDTA